MSDKPIYVEAMEVIADLKVIAKEKAGEIAALKAENEKLKKRWEYKAVMDADEKLSKQAEVIERYREAFVACFGLFGCFAD